MSDVNTRILERNRVATEVLHAVLMDEIKSKNISDNFRNCDDDDDDDDDDNDNWGILLRVWLCFTGFIT